MSPRCNQSYNVMVVDDDPSVLSTYRRLLERSGYAARTESQPLRVLEHWQHEGAELLLIDYRMPDLDGLSLLAELRHRGCRARCILISAYLNDDVRHQAGLLGVDRVLEKPVDVIGLRQTLSELLPTHPARVAG